VQRTGGTGGSYGPGLNESVLLERTTGAGREFHTDMIRLEKKNLCVLVLASGTVILRGWPRKLRFGLRVKNSLLTEILSWSIL
jgi:hypothetical protein